MIRKSLSNIINKAWDCKFSQTRHSALFINGAKATEHYVYVTPHIDFTDKIQHKETLLKDLFKRKANIDLERVENLWQVYQDLNARKIEYTKRKDEISRELGKLIRSEPDSDNTKKLKIQSAIMKDNLKKLKAPLWSAEEAAIVEVLKLPNTLHSRTPDDQTKVLYTHLDPPKNSKDHLQIGKELNIIDFKKNENYYLKGDGALFELGSKFYFNKILKEIQFIQFSNPDFVKSLVVEGCGIDHTSPDSTFILHHNEDSALNVDSRMHLVGGGSLSSFLAYHAKNVLHAKTLPLKYFTMGRQYLPSPRDEDSLFHVSQSSVIEFFGAAKTADEVDKILENLTDILKDAYGRLGFHFRLVLQPADKLHMWESLRVAVEMYSSSLKDYVEVANVSVSGDFISKRMMFMYVEDKQNKFPHLITGTILNVPKFLGCVLEQDAEFSVPDLFKVHNWAL